MKKFLLYCIGMFLGYQVYSQVYVDAGYTLSGINAHAANRAVFLYNFTRRDWLQKPMPFIGLLHGTEFGIGYRIKNGYIEAKLQLSWNTYNAHGIPPGQQEVTYRQVRMRNHAFQLGGGYYLFDKDFFKLSIKGMLGFGDMTYKTRTYGPNFENKFEKADHTLQISLHAGVPIELHITKPVALVIEPYVTLPTFNLAGDDLQERINQNYLNVGENYPVYGGIKLSVRILFDQL